MESIYNISFRTILVLLILFFITKLLGKKQVSQLSLFDYVIGITIGSIAADISLDIEKNLLAGIISLFIYGIIGYLISLITMKSIKLRRYITGVPTLLIDNGKIIESGLKKVKIDINELLSQARMKGYFNIDEINSAIMEVNGSISFLPKEEEKPSTKKDVNVKTNGKGLTANVIIDGKYMNNNIRASGKDRKWLNHELKVKGYNNVDNIILATIDTNYKLCVYEKNVKSKETTILE